MFGLRLGSRILMFWWLALDESCQSKYDKPWSSVSVHPSKEVDPSVDDSHTNDIHVLL